MPRLAALIFVSSTTEDLEDYRSALVRQFPRLDVLYRGMEFFGARHQPPKDVMLTEVGMCDLFLGILGNRYGSVDPESGLSYTELKYREAMRKRIPTLMFVMDPAQAITPARFESDAGKRQQLDSFKEAVRKEHAVRHFRSPEDFASEAIDGIRRWLVEHADEWKTTKIEPKEKDFIRMLYSESADTMERAVQNVAGLGFAVPRAVRHATANPARVLGLTDRGRIAPVARADLVALDPHTLAVRSVWSAGTHMRG